MILKRKLISSYNQLHSVYIGYLLFTTTATLFLRNANQFVLIEQERGREREIICNGKIFFIDLLQVQVAS
jgi:hypothetical protein